MNPHVTAIVPAAGAGTRLGAGAPKALVELSGKPLLSHAVAALLATGQVGQVVLAAPAGLTDEVEGAARLVSGAVPVVVVQGGATRVESVALALAAVEHADFVLVHDAARALVPPEVVAAVIAALTGGAQAVVPGLAVVDTIRQLDPAGSSRTLDRSNLRAVQTPQGFPTEVLRAAHARPDLGHATDDAGMAEALGVPVTIVPGHPEAMKVTTPLDLITAAGILAARTAGNMDGEAG